MPCYDCVVRSSGYVQSQVPVDVTYVLQKRNIITSMDNLSFLVQP
jgi:hypothetical protein